VVKLATVTAATGTTPIPPPAPPCAALVMALVEVAVTSMSPVLLMTPAPVVASRINACVVSSITLIATDAPMPTLEPVAVPCGIAEAVSALLLRALIVIVPVVAVPVVVRLAPLLTCAVVSRCPTLIASEPAIPTLPPPAPDFDCAAKVSVPLTGVLADTVMPTPLKVAPAPTNAVLVTSPTLIATAAPIPTPLALPLPLPLPLPLLLLAGVTTAEPSAVAVAVVSAAEVTLIAPAVAVTLVFGEIVAEVLVSARFTATAAATSTEEEPLEEPLLVAACGVVPDVELSRAPRLAATLFPLPRSPAT
jgi:hypothetical protein